MPLVGIRIHGFIGKDEEGKTYAVRPQNSVSLYDYEKDEPIENAAVLKLHIDAERAIVNYSLLDGSEHTADFFGFSDEPGPLAFVPPTEEEKEQ